MAQRNIPSRSTVACPAMALFSVLLLISVPQTRAQETSLDPLTSNSSRFEHRRHLGAADGVLSGTVSLSTDNRAATQVIVTVRSLQSGESYSLLTDFAGRFEVRGLDPGPYAVTAEESGYETTSVTTMVLRGPSEVSLDLTPLNPSVEGKNGPTVSVHELKMPSKARDSFQKGLQHLNKQDPAGSLPYFTKAIEKFPYYYEAFYHLGLAQGRLGQNDRAMKSFESAIDLSGGSYPSAEFSYALLLCHQGNVHEAERTVRHGLQQDQDTAFGHIALGVVMLYSHRPEEAERSAREALLRNPHSADAHLILADAHAQKGDYQAEVQELDTFLQLEPDGARSNFARDLRGAAEKVASREASKSQNNNRIASAVPAAIP
jgi:Tfp pilus assembly protein PilF